MPIPKPVKKIVKVAGVALITKVVTKKAVRFLPGYVPIAITSFVVTKVAAKTLKK